MVPHLGSPKIAGFRIGAPMEIPKLGFQARTASITSLAWISTERISSTTTDDGVLGLHADWRRNGAAITEPTRTAARYGMKRTPFLRTFRTSRRRIARKPFEDDWRTTKTADSPGVRAITLHHTVASMSATAVKITIRVSDVGFMRAAGPELSP